MKTLTLNFSTGYLNKYSHIKIGGKTDYLFKAKSVSDLSIAYIYAKRENRKVIPLGGGSNILFGDTGNIIIIPDKFLPKYIKFEGEFVRVSANWNINALIMTLKRKKLGGLEFLAGIPAHIGGLVFMNASAYDNSISNFVKEIKIINLYGKKRTIKKEEIRFEYRKTNIKGFIYEVLLEPIKRSIRDIERDIKFYIKKRLDSQPLIYPNLGSIFKNPENDYAGRLIEQAGLKGVRIGGAKIYEKHANFIINFNNASFKDVIELVKMIKESVKYKFNKNLETEIRVVQWQKR